ncbi:MAG: ABC transporter permease [Halanaerobiaceae bacterium]
MMRMSKTGERFYRRMVLASIILLVISGVFSGLFSYMWEIRGELIELLGQHLYLVGVSIAMALVIGLAVGIALSRAPLRKYSGPLMYFVGLGQTIPSLAVLALSMSFLGTGSRPALFALTIYTVLPIARNTLAGLESVSPELIDAARGMGLSGRQVLFAVELPVAVRVIMAGVRMAVIINISSAALGAVIGAGGLGEQIFTGISFFDFNIILSGALPVAIMALTADYLLQLLEEKLAGPV